MKPLLVVFFVYFFLILYSYLFPANRKYRKVISKPATYIEGNALGQRLKQKAALSRQFALQNGLSSHYVFLIDMRLPSGKKRFFVYDFTKDSLIITGLVAHGSCNTSYMAEPAFSNALNSGCSSLGRFKVGGAYQGRFGKAFKLYGLDSSNANCYERAIVLHAYKHVPDVEVYPRPICNSLGCPMISYHFLETLSQLLKKERKPVLLWIYT